MKLFLLFSCLSIVGFAHSAELGTAVNIQEGRLMSAVCVDNSQVRLDSSGSNQLNLNQEAIIKSRSRSVKGKASVSADILIISGSLKSSIDYSYLNYGESEHEFVSRNYSGGLSYLAEFELTPEAKALYESSFNSFIALCGTGFIYAKKEAVILDSKFEINFKNFYERNAKKTKVKASVLFGLISKSKTYVDEVIESYGIKTITFQNDFLENGSIKSEYSRCTQNHEICISRYKDFIDSIYLQNENQSEVYSWMSYEAIGLSMWQPLSVLKQNQIFSKSGIRLARLKFLESKLNRCPGVQIEDLVEVREVIALIEENQRYCMNNVFASCAQVLADLSTRNLPNITSDCMLY